jgi:hypothetical protein
MMFGELLEHNISFLLCLENYWNGACNCCDVFWADYFHSDYLSELVITVTRYNCPLPHNTSCESVYISCGMGP